MLLVHDLHAISGEHEFTFEDSVRDEYAPGVTKVGGRLLWYFHHTHGAGDAYHMVTLTALPDGEAWEQLTESLRYGDLASWSARADAMRYHLTSTLLVETAWSPLGDVALDGVPSPTDIDRDPIVFREDLLTGPDVARTMEGAFAAARPSPDTDVLEIVAAFVPALSTNDDEVRILYRIPSKERWTQVFGQEPEWTDWSGSLSPTLPHGVRNASRMLRTARWSSLA